MNKRTYQTPQGMIFLFTESDIITTSTTMIDHDFEQQANELPIFF